MALMILTRTRLLGSAALALAATALAPMTVHAQEEGPDAPDTAQSGYSSLNVVQPRGTRELQDALQRLALNPADIDALIDGGNAALLLGDPQAALGFFARADEMAPGNGRVKAGLASSLLLNENPYDALRLFDEAKRLGVPESVFASDRGLAYDLVGNYDAAQADYELALRRGGDDETIRRYALSLGIAGDRAAAEAQLDPLLRKRDAAAWRTRAFVLAVTGDAQGAIDIADATMPKRMAASIEPFFRFMSKLTPAQQAAAAHFGSFPQTAAIGKDDPRNRQYASASTPRQRSRAGRADAGLIPAGEPLGPVADSKGRKTAKTDKSQRRRPGKLSKKEEAQIAAAQAEAAARPVPVQARPAGPVPPPDLLMRGRGAAPATVQPIPSPSPSSPAPAQAPVRMASAPTQAPAAAPSVAMVQPLPPSPAGADASAPPASQVAAATASAPLVMNPVRESVRQPGAIFTPPPSANTRSSPPPAPPSPSPSPSPELVPSARPVQMARLDDPPRPGFASLPSGASGSSTPAAAPVAATAAQAPAGELPPVPSAPMTQAVAAPVAAAAQGATAGAASFDLAQIGAPAPASPAAPSAVPASPPPVASATVAASAPSVTPPARVSLSAIIAEIQVPPQELAPSQDAVDITRIKPAAPKPAGPSPEELKKAEAKKAEAKKAEAKKAEAKKAAPKHPKRYWVQVAGGANRNDLAKEWKRLVGVAPAAFKGKQGWWTPLNSTNRLLTGPFASDKEAQAFVNMLAKQKLSGFSFTSAEGQEVTKLGS